MLFYVFSYIFALIGFILSNAFIMFMIFKLGNHIVNILRKPNLTSHIIIAIAGFCAIEGLMIILVVLSIIAGLPLIGIDNTFAIPPSWRI